MVSETLFCCLKLILKNTIVKRMYVIAADELSIINYANSPCAIILNSSNRSNPPGKHWLSLFVYKQKSKIKAIFWDSYMQPFYVYNFKFPFPVESIIAAPIQSYFSDVCGLHALYFLFYIARGKGAREILKHFTNNSKLNDKKVVSFYKAMTQPHSKRRGQICCNRLRNKF